MASHIVPWSVDVIKRGWLRNVICFCVLHDKLFETGKIIVDGNNHYQIKFEEDFLKSCTSNKTYSKYKNITRKHLLLPLVNIPDPDLLLRHRKRFKTKMYI